MGKKSVSGPKRTTPEVRCSYLNAFTAYKGKYGARLMFDKKNPEHKAFLGELKKDAEAVIAQMWPNPADRPRTPILGQTRSLIKDGDTTVDTQSVPYSEKNPEVIGHWFTSSSSSKPLQAIVDANNQPILDFNELYSGCFIRARVNVYTYDNEFGKGLSLGLTMIQKRRDGEALGGGGGYEAVDAAFDADGIDSSAENDPLAGVQEDSDPF